MSVLDEMRMTERPISTGATAIYPYAPSLEERFTFTSRFGDEVELFKRIGEHVYLPLALCPVRLNDARVLGVSVTFPKAPEPRPLQAQVFADTIAFLQAGQSGVVCAYTGWGKTGLGYGAAAAIKRKTLVITTKEDIFNQWIDRAEKFLGLARERPASGAFAGAKGDIDLGAFLIECKSSTQMSMALKFAWLLKIAGEAMSEGKKPCLAVSFVDEQGRPHMDGDWVMVQRHAFEDIIR